MHGKWILQSLKYFCQSWVRIVLVDDPFRANWGQSESDTSQVRAREDIELDKYETNRTAAQWVNYRSQVFLDCQIPWKLDWRLYEREWRHQFWKIESSSLIDDHREFFLLQSTHSQNLSLSSPVGCILNRPLYNSLLWPCSVSYYLLVRETLVRDRSRDRYVTLKDVNVTWWAIFLSLFCSLSICSTTNQPLFCGIVTLSCLNSNHHSDKHFETLKKAEEEGSKRLIDCKFEKNLIKSLLQLGFSRAWEIREWIKSLKNRPGRWRCYLMKNGERWGVVSASMMLSMKWPPNNLGRIDFQPRLIGWSHFSSGLAQWQKPSTMKRKFKITRFTSILTSNVGTKVSEGQSATNETKKKTCHVPEFSVSNHFGVVATASAAGSVKPLERLFSALASSRVIIRGMHTFFLLFCYLFFLLFYDNFTANYLAMFWFVTDAAVFVVVTSYEICLFTHSKRGENHEFSQQSILVTNQQFHTSHVKIFSTCKKTMSQSRHTNKKS